MATLKEKAAAPVTVAAMFGKAPQTSKLPLSKPMYVDNAQLMGVELEYEHATQARERLEGSYFWTPHEDGSLRNGGWEFLLNRPRAGAELAGAIAEFFEKTKGAGLAVNGRTSCHLHLNMTEPETTREDLQGTVLVYNALEDLLWAQTHKQRRWSGYCMPLLEAQPQLVAALMRPPTNNNLTRAYNLPNTTSRYSALNLGSLVRHGSIEFRHFSNPVSADQLNEWINLTHLIKQAGKSMAVKEGALTEAVNKDPSLVLTAIKAVPTLMGMATKFKITPRTVVDATERLLGVVEVLSPTSTETQQLRAVLQEAGSGGGVADLVNEATLTPFEEYQNVFRDMWNRAFDGAWREVIGENNRDSLASLLHTYNYPWDRGRVTPTIVSNMLVALGVRTSTNSQRIADLLPLSGYRAWFNRQYAQRVGPNLADELDITFSDF
jgi:hypothetical protein